MSHDYNADDPAQEPVIPSGFLKLDEIQGETQTRWLWPGKVPLGHVTIVAGEASSGKSLLAAEIAARVSSGGGWPDAAGVTPGTERSAGSVLIAHANQHENLVLKGRLLAAGADQSRVAVMNRDVFCLDRQIGAEQKGHHEPALTGASLCTLEGALFQVPDASLLIIDHLLGWLGVSRLRPDQLTEVFERLADMAARYRVAVVVLWRLEKGGRAAQTRALDTLSSIAPLVWLLANDTYSSYARSAVCAQNRLGAPSEGLSFLVAGDRVVWQDLVGQASADDLIAARTADRHERRQAGQWLLELLAQGPIVAKQLWHEARECGLAERTLRRAAAELGLRPTKDGKRNAWLWGLRPPAGSVQNVAALRGIGTLAGAGGGAEEVSGEQNVAALPAVGSLADSVVVRLELRPDAPPSVAALPPVGSLAGAGGEAEVVSGEQNVAALPSVGSLAKAEGKAQEVSSSEQNVIDRVCSSAGSDEEEQKRPVEAIEAATDSEGDSDRARRPKSAAARKHRLREERRAIERTLRICRDG